MNHYLIETRDLTKKYGEQTSVSNLNLHVQKGRIYGLLGRNGAGKTTTMRMLLGLTKPSFGNIRLFGAPLSCNEKNVLPRIGSLIEAPGFYPNLTGTENLALFAKLRGLSGSDPIKRALSLVNLPYRDKKLFSQYSLGMKQRLTENLALFAKLRGLSGSDPIKRALSLVNLPYRDKKLFSQYSLGMKQRLAIALAVMHDPELLILDEPINGLDPIGIAEVRSFIRELSAVRGKTILISSHILPEIALLADDIGIIDHGVLLEEESLSDLEKKSEKHLHFTVSDIHAATAILETTLGIHDFELLPPHELILPCGVGEIGVIVRHFVENGLIISDAHLCEETLEDYFKRITGGEGIA